MASAWGSLFAGLLGPGAPRGAKEQDEASQGISLYVRPFGLKVLEIMGFGPLANDGRCGEYYHSVERGILAARGEKTNRGRLYFRWRRVGRDEIFETEMRDYSPRIAGLARGGALGLGFYKLTQLNIHRVVMWGYHRWVRHHRFSLLGEAAGQISRERRGDRAPAALPESSEAASNAPS